MGFDSEGVGDPGTSKLSNNLITSNSSEWIRICKTLKNSGSFEKERISEWQVSCSNCELVP